MAHNLMQNDSMLAVGKRPWHGLGVTLAEAPKTAQEALEIAGCAWMVDKEDLYLGNGRRVQVTGSVSAGNDGLPGAIVRRDTQEILGVVGPAYTPFQNHEMAALFEPLVASGELRIETVGSLFNGRRVWMLGKFGSNAQIDNGGDEVAKYLLLAHGHDGQFAVRFGFTPIRVVCWNTLSAATKKGDENKLIRCLHTSGLKGNLDTLRGAMVAAEQVFELTAEQFRALAQRGVNRTDLNEYARQVVDAPTEYYKRTNPQKQKIAAIVENAMHGKGNRGANWWHAYNGVTEYVSWQAGRTKDRRLSEAWFGGGADTNREALQLALQMAGVA